MSVVLPISGSKILEVSMFDESSDSTIDASVIAAVVDTIPVVWVTDVLAAVVDTAPVVWVMDVTAAVVDTVPLIRVTDSLLITPASSPIVGLEATVGVLGMVDVLLVVETPALAVVVEPHVVVPVLLLADTLASG